MSTQAVSRTCASAGMKTPMRIVLRESVTLILNCIEGVKWTERYIERKT
jgi:hypothetical protein